jgi:ankyrin repeat protein
MSLPALSRRSLHDMLKNSSSSENDILQAIQDYPEALRQKDSNSYCPIQIECDKKCRPVIIWKLIELYPESLAQACKEGRLPLHHLLWTVASSSQDPAIVHLMIEAYPKAICRPDRSGNLPIHIECENRYRPDIISKLIELYPGSLSEKCILGSLPLHSPQEVCFMVTRSCTILNDSPLDD